MESLNCLDYRRLGKQRVECFQILNVLEKLRQDPDQKIAWKNHPAVRMWAGNVEALKCYYNLTVLLWIIKGYKNTMKLQDITGNGTRLLKLAEVDPQEMRSAAESYVDVLLQIIVADVCMPNFIGDEDFHRAHQSNLIRKYPEHYGPLFPGVPIDLEYIWPMGLTEKSE